MQNQVVFSETSEHAARLEGSRVTVFRKSHGVLIPYGEPGRWEGGIIRGSGVNCGVLVRLEQDLREKTGTP